MKFMNKTQKRKGSTLALTIIIFAVLMIFATFTLGFMVTENKQAMYYQNKTQAYYYAKSGADIVEKAIVDQLRSYGNDSAGVSSYLSTYGTGYGLNLNLNDSVATISINYDKVNESATNNVLIIDSEAEFNNVKSSIRKIIYSVVNKISTTNNEIIYEGQGQFLIYKDYGLMHHNQTAEGGEVLPPEYGRKATETEANEYGIQHFDPIKWEDDGFHSISWENPVESDLNILGLSSDGLEIDNFVLYESDNSTYGEVGKTTNVYVDGPLDLSSRNLTFIGEVNLFIKDNLLIRSAVNIISEKDSGNHLLDIYVYNVTNEPISLGMYGITGTGSPISNISIIGNIYVDYVQFDETDSDIYGEAGDVFMFFHQDTHIDGSIIYNGSGNLKLKSQPNNINQLSKLISGSIYAPYANVELGDETNKVAFVIDGIIFADTIDIYSLNATQIGRFFSNSFESGSAHIPVEVGTTTNETYVTYRSYYSD